MSSKQREPELNDSYVSRVDLGRLIAARRAASPEFAEAFDEARAEREIARLLVEKRKKAQLTQREVAERVGSTQSAISRLEQPDYTGRTIGMLRRYAAALGMELKVEFVEALPQGRRAPRPISTAAGSPKLDARDNKTSRKRSRSSTLNA
jgi:transcriptional regulator with XRE-family HTH domain